MRNKMLYSITAILSLILVTSSCSEKKTDLENTKKEVEVALKVPVVEFASLDSATFGSISGKVVFEGEVPEQRELRIGNPECGALNSGRKVMVEDVVVNNGYLKNVFVYIKEGLEGYKFDTPTESVVLDQKKCMYTPHVIGVQVDQPISVVNSDPVLHNVHSFPENSDPWNLAFPVKGMQLDVNLSDPEIMVPVRCDVHPWMLAYIGVIEHPYFCVTGSDGKFELKNVPAGKYVLEAWHEKFGTKTQTIEIGPKEEKNLTFTFSAES